MTKPTRVQWALSTEQIGRRLARIESEVISLNRPTADDARSWLLRYAHEWDRDRPLTIEQYKRLSPLARALRDGFVISPDDALLWALGQLGATVARHERRLAIERGQLEHVLECRNVEAALAALDEGADDDIAGSPSGSPAEHIEREVTTYAAPNVTAAAEKLAGAEERTLPLFATIDPEQAAVLDGIRDAPEA